MDPLTITAANAVAQGIGGIVQGVTGAFQKGKAKRMGRANKRPNYRIQQPIKDNQELIESQAGQGLTDASRQELEQQSSRGLTSSIDAILAGGGSVNNISDLYGTFQGGISKMALIDEEMRRKNIQNLVTANNQLATEKDKEWQVNVYAPYADKAQAAAALSNQGTNNMWKGINTVLSAGANYETSRMYKKETQGIYGTNGNTGAPDPAMPPGGTGYMPNYNWYQPESNSPGIYPPPPMTPQQRVQSSYPGLMIDPSLFGGG